MARHGEKSPSGARSGRGHARTATPESSERGREGRRSGPVEAIFQELVRRAATAGFSSFFMTEETLRRAFARVVPREWVDFAASQSSEMRKELLDRLSREFGAWLRALDPEALQRIVLQTLLEDYEFTVKIEISAQRRSGEGAVSLKLLPRRK